MSRLERALLVTIVVLVGGAAGAVSFTHMHDWTIANSPPGTPDWYGWVNACVSELVPVAALLEVRRRRRAGRPIGYPLGLLVAAACLSLAAQLAVAVPSPSGWLLSAVPALAFMALTKLVFSGLPLTHRRGRRGGDRPAAPPVAASSALVPSVPPGARLPAQRPHHYRARLTDDEILEALRDPERIPRDRDGYVPVKRVTKALGIGPDRARRLLTEAGLRRPVPTT